ncbi:MAG: alanine--glyoxylate aminotransferase family protein [Parasporobacterium sp.]|nr:alanine--glyoxylate aminotransferase family protein [Parasporobacterium sp.]
MILFTVGPVQMYPETLKTEGTQLPYFRTENFGSMMKESEELFLRSVKAPEKAYFIALTSSGTGAMDAAVQNVLNGHDKVLVINGGSFGSRFADITRRYGIDTDTYDIPFLCPFSKEEFEKYSGRGYTALLVNACETSTGQKYDLDYLGDFCRRNDMIFIVDAVSAYLADPVDMEGQKIDVLITASQKALALSPGVSLIALSERAKDRCSGHKASYYFDFLSYIDNQKRGQPPFTSAVGTMIALNQRLKAIMAEGTEKENALHAARAEYFRKALMNLPVSIPDIPLSNCCTPVIFPEKNAGTAYKTLMEEYGLVLTPSGGGWKDIQLRVGHLGNLSEADYDKLLEAMQHVLDKRKDD